MKIKLAIVLIALLSNISVVNAHDSHTHKAPWQACEQKQKAQQCAYHNGVGDLFIGTCQSFKQQLTCVRNKPIVYASELATKAKQKIKSKAVVISKY
ncbi:hypothetical protein KO505_14050 [Psychrosphaera sp. F3M07]|uniref:hypothetical protein n=1 Tax=Psychrosphaera sp. F3M07 TaxID=2841560 RepID=UPI001C081B9D|nr:hypothetical protein [Psychrosphaera sp. F3M07]MBU2919070.1 hypothetical protein [Psychrosphaera sp. F3M07]